MRTQTVFLVIATVLLLVTVIGNHFLASENQSLKATVEYQEGVIEGQEVQIEYFQTGYIDPPEIIGEIEKPELGLFLKDILGEEALGASGKEAPIYILDWKYKLTTAEEIERFLEIDATDELGYIHGSEYFDCDDFAFKLMGRVIIPPDWSGIAFGIMVAQFDANEQYHAFNVFVTKENEEWVLYRIEPQDDCIKRVERGSIYKVKFVIF